MTQNQTLTKKPLAEIGAEIGQELGVQMIQTFQAKHPNDTSFYIIGRKIIDQILAQPGCVGIKFFNALNEAGEQTMVYVGLDNDGKAILKVASVNTNGQLSEENGIVADRIDRGRGSGSTGTGISLPDADDWVWGE
jgi:hypothetical protein